MRMSFQTQKEVLEMPNLIEIQKDSYQWFLDAGLKEVFRDIFPIEDFAGHFSLDFVNFKLARDEVKYSIEECKDRDTTYAAPLKVKIRLINKDKDEINEHEIFLGDLPLMTDTGSFVINGAERVIVSQLVRSPGIYYTIEHDKIGKELFMCQVIPNRGAWLEYETDSNDIFYARVDRTRKVPITVLLRAFGLGTNTQITDMLNEGIDILFANAVDRSGIESALYECEKRGVPVILLDTDVDNRVGVISAIQSDNYKAGVLLAKDLINKKPDGAKILIVANLIASSMVQRRQGFIDTISNEPKYEIVDEIDGVSEIETVNEAMKEYLKTNNKDIDVIFGLNDPTAIGAIAALREKSEKRILIYGVDGSPDAKELIKQGLFTATVAQHPIYMGKEASKVAYDYLAEREVESDIYIDVDLINAGNIAKFDISKWQ